MHIGEFGSAKEAAQAYDMTVLAVKGADQVSGLGFGGAG